MAILCWAAKNSLCGTAVVFLTALSSKQSNMTTIYKNTGDKFVYSILFYSFVIISANFRKKWR